MIMYTTLSIYDSTAIVLFFLAKFGLVRGSYVFIMLFYKNSSKSCITERYRSFGVDLELS